MSSSPDSKATGLGELDRLIHEPARLVLMKHLYVIDEADFLYLSRRTGLTDGNISSHMTRLEDAGYVKVTKSFVDRRPRTTYALTAAGRTAFEKYRKQVVNLLEGSE
ncbi:MAG: winged helix-turn-helix domain-containing protein [Acidimicrobiia bacterium]